MLLLCLGRQLALCISIIINKYLVSFGRRGWLLNMATATVSVAQKYGIPPFTEDGDYDQWLFEIEMWKEVTDLAKQKQGPVLFLSLNQKTRNSLSTLKKEEISCDGGIDVVIKKLEELYALNKDQAMFAAYEKFEEFLRPSTMDIKDFIIEFEKRNQKLLNYKIDLPSVVRAYRLLKQANLPEEKRNLVRATVPDLTYESMRKQLKAIHDYCIIDEEKKNDGCADSSIEVEEAYYSEMSSANPNWRMRSNISRSGYRGRGGYSSPPNNYDRGGRGRGTSNRKQRGTCHVCKSINHYADKCPDRINKSSDDIQYFTNESIIDQCFLEQEVSDALNCAIVDSGCTRNVCGVNWLNCYLDTLPSDVEIKEELSDRNFSFGPSKTYKSLKQVTLPARIGCLDKNIKMDVVDCEIPLLLSKEYLKSGGCKLDFINDSCELFGENIQLQNTSSSHYCIPISPRNLVSGVRKVEPVSDVLNEVYVTIDHLDEKSSDEKHSIALKLHKTFGHPLDSSKIKVILKDAGVNDCELNKAVDTVTDSCDTCDKYRKVRSRPVVSLPFAHDFNDCLALDLKFLTVNNKKYIILHMIDIFTRYSQATIIPAKDKHTVVKAILKQWVGIFGTPQSIFSDNGGEFRNDLLRDVAELLGTRVATSAAYSPWSNGIVERHNAVLENMVLKITADDKCSVENAIVWSISAKNSLHNNRGFSPNQLVFGRNPNLPSILTAKPPELRTHTSSKLIAEHLNALHAARAAFIQSEASNKLKVALSKQTRTATCKSYNLGDRVYYKRNDKKEWHGPGIVIGVDSKTAIVDHGGQCLRVSAVHLRPVNENSNNVSSKLPIEKTGVTMVQNNLNDNNKIMISMDIDEPFSNSNVNLEILGDVINNDDRDENNYGIGNQESEEEIQNADDNNLEELLQNELNFDTAGDNLTMDNNVAEQSLYDVLTHLI